MVLPQPLKRIRPAGMEEPIVVKRLPDGFFKQVDLRDPLHIVTVSVGAAPDAVKSFQVHEELLTARSPFFRAAFQKDRKKGRERVLELPEDKPESFEQYAWWIYCGKIENKVKPSTSVPHVRILTRTYAFGCKVCDVDFMDTIMDTLIEKLGTDVISWKSYATDLVENFYLNVPPGSAARRLVVFMIAHSWTREMLETFYTRDAATRYPDILLEIAAASLDGRGRTTPRKLGEGPCDYHEHKGRGEPCYKTKGEY
ncbi:hypothetical protein LTR60_005495 [Cryomyces antarcticus]|nr:hypothetical protein LTR39_006425 [Cryomyces antarcticus]KAK5008257.1 hypothetical protein LTR60_005495 [Cryomyces antarcticus]KAK5153532.1 hypothetical protein LTR04_006200 [Oleoguttula sp. CCFEE 6159]